MIRNLEVIGEAVKNLSAEIKAANTEVPWRRIAGMRDTLIHRYFGVKLPLVWEVVDTELPPFRRVTASLISELADAPEGTLPPT